MKRRRLSAREFQPAIIALDNLPKFLYNSIKQPNKAKKKFKLGLKLSQSTKKISGNPLHEMVECLQQLRHQILGVSGEFCKGT